MVRKTGHTFSVTEFFNTNLSNIAGREIVNFILKLYEKFPVNPLIKMFKLWWGVNVYKPKICQHTHTYIYIYIYIL